MKVYYLFNNKMDCFDIHRLKSKILYLECKLELSNEINAKYIEKLKEKIEFIKDNYETEKKMNIELKHKLKKIENTWDNQIDFVDAITNSIVSNNNYHKKQEIIDDELKNK